MERATHHNCGMKSSAARFGRPASNPAGSIQESFIIGPRTSTSWRTWMICLSQVLLLNSNGSKEKLRKSYEIKGEMLKHGGMVKFLGREIRLTQDGFTWASDPKHAQLLIDELGLHEANGTDVPLGLEDRPEMDATKEPMSVNEAKFYRRCAANGAGQTRPLCCGQLAEPSHGQPKEG